MTKLIRLENTFYGLDDTQEETIDKILEFDSECGKLVVHKLHEPSQIKFKQKNT